jgi:hypothetical protein
VPGLLGGTASEQQGFKSREFRAIVVDRRDAQVLPPHSQPRCPFLEITDFFDEKLRQGMSNEELIRVVVEAQRLGVRRAPEPFSMLV